MGKAVRKKKKSLTFALVFVFLSIVFFAGVWTFLNFQRKGEVPIETPRIPDSGRMVIDTTVHRDTVPVLVIDTIEPAKVHRKFLNPVELVDTVLRVDSLVHNEDTAEYLDKGDVPADEYDMMTTRSTRNCADDTLVLWVYPEPAGGLHRTPIAVTFHANKPCVIEWKYESDSIWHFAHETTVSIEKTSTIHFKAIDSCGKIMGQREEYYEIEIAEVSSLCPEGMDMVKIGATQFCIDRYEWPNHRGRRPLAYVSLYEAEDSCFSVGKRLCSSEEWTLACAGPYSAKYPYGQNYELYACVTNDTAMRSAGSRPECRAFFGSFDMSGNLAEWTSTASVKDRSFNNVMGGFWQSGSASGCFEKRYSYFPQNRHNPVGFRCCKNISGENKK